jgi:hypothetical protein
MKVRTAQIVEEMVSFILNIGVLIFIGICGYGIINDRANLVQGVIGIFYGLLVLVIYNFVPGCKKQKQ